VDKNTPLGQEFATISCTRGKVGGLNLVNLECTLDTIMCKWDPMALDLGTNNLKALISH